MVAFTGAGHSTASGIPDFRSPDSGLWEKHNPMLVASVWAFRLNPKTFYDWIRPMADLVLTARPNLAHEALADLEAMGYLRTIITQNIDNLHQRAGSRRVLELHGHLREATCIRCYKVEPIDPVFHNLVREGHVPRCTCGGVFKPNVILFGEQLPVRILNEAMAEARRCDLMLVAGSSLTVLSGFRFVRHAHKAGIPVVIVNRGATRGDELATHKVDAGCAPFLTDLADLVGGGTTSAGTSYGQETSRRTESTMPSAASTSP